jgi:hypothetical protein
MEGVVCQQETKSAVFWGKLHYYLDLSSSSPNWHLYMLEQFVEGNSIQELRVLVAGFCSCQTHGDSFGRSALCLIAIGVSCP